MYSTNSLTTKNEKKTISIEIIEYDKAMIKIVPTNSQRSTAPPKISHLDLFSFLGWITRTDKYCVMKLVIAKPAPAQIHTK